MLKVTPLNDPDKAASVSFFTMDFLKGFSLYSAVDSLQEYDLGLFLSLQNIGEREFPAEWHLSDPEVARFFEGALHAEKNGCAFLSTDYRGRTYSQMVCFKTQMDDFETELNETPESANALTEGVFVDGNMFDEKDYFALEIEEDTYIQAAYYNEGDTADTRMEILSADGEVLASAVSTDGTDVMLPVGLRAGIYYIRLTPNGDIDDVSFYSLIYKTGSAIDIGGLVETEGNNEPATATTLPMDSCLTGKLATPEDLDVYLVDLDSTTYINLYFESAEGTKPYDLFIYNQIEQNPITRITVEAAQEFTMPLGLRPGKYYIQVSGADLDGDDLHRYQLCVQEFQAENYEVESNNTPLYGNSLPSEAPIQGRITYSRDVDYFGFTTQESGYIQMAFTPSSETGDYTIQLMGEDGIPFFPIHSLDGAEKPLNMSQAPGRYYVKISAYQGGDVDNQSDYTLSFVSGLPIEGLTTLLGVSIEAPETELEVDGGMQLKAWGHYSGDSQDLTNQVTWTSLSPDIADVDASGLVTGYGEGSATIVASAGKYSDQASLSVGEAATYAHSRGNLIIVAGGGVSSDNTLRESTQYLCNQLYLTYKRRGFDDDDIYYLNTVTQIDLDGDGYWDAIVDSSAPAASALEYAITEFAANENTNGPLAVYLNGHGGSGSFQIMPDDILSASQMDAWLDEFQAATDRQVIVIIESCKSGSFAGDILSSGENRIVLSSTGDLDSYVNLAGAASFSQFLSDRLLLGDSLSQAYLKAAQSLSALGEPYAGMTPLLLQGLDGLASSAFVGGNFAIASPFPAFTDQTVNQEIDASAVLDIFAAVTALDDLESVWAVVTPPDYQRPETGQDFDAPETGLPIIILEGNDDNGAWEGTYEDFAYNGQHRFVFYAKSIYGNVAVSPVTIITVKNGENLGEPGDLDGDGLLTIKDMILGLRILCGLEDESGFPQGADVNEDGALGLEEIVFLLNNM
ncbi:Ig-like domain-containing protein [Desulfatibacillum aliphaticivorans]|nr:Ig-like domain-containing protein [Desulfatibacillum aliphaticivorans]